jgi:AcrR family transcriptional regulator
MNKIQHKDQTLEQARKIPQQSRSKATVSFIKEAAIDILAKEGISACRTERIAERAGVSIGSIYKYFQNREAVFIALYEDATFEYFQALDKLTLKIMELSIEEGMLLTLRTMLSMFEKHRVVLLQLSDEMPELRLQDRPMTINKLVHTNVKMYVQQRNPSLPAAEVVTRSFFIERCVFGCMQGFLTDAPGKLSRRKFIADMSHVVAGIIEQPQG